MLEHEAMSLAVANAVKDPRYTKLGAEFIHARTAKSEEQGTYATDARARHSKAYQRSNILKVQKCAWSASTLTSFNGI